ncbi:hypothetical protein R3P38DRAFT_3206048 [Favolaschia claudopus]|uniref:Cysteine protease n=1 Tax=Favolaschia claudopus TaxID=2862362 RepID=A0AAW0AN53_9AGAR
MKGSTTSSFTTYSPAEPPLQPTTPPANRTAHAHQSRLPRTGRPVWGTWNPARYLHGFSACGSTVSIGIDGTIIYTPRSVDIAGGRPSLAHYFIGVQGGGLSYLDLRHLRLSAPLNPVHRRSAAHTHLPASSTFWAQVLEMLLSRDVFVAIDGRCTLTTPSIFPWFSPPPPSFPPACTPVGYEVVVEIVALLGVNEGFRVQIRGRQGRGRELGAGLTCERMSYTVCIGGGSSSHIRHSPLIVIVCSASSICGSTPHIRPLAS